jgi:hypothetical protein
MREPERDVSPLALRESTIFSLSVVGTLAVIVAAIGLYFYWRGTFAYYWSWMTLVYFAVILLGLITLAFSFVFRAYRRTTIDEAHSTMLTFEEISALDGEPNATLLQELQLRRKRLLQIGANRNAVEINNAIGQTIGASRPSQSQELPERQERQKQLP